MSTAKDKHTSPGQEAIKAYVPAVTKHWFSSQAAREGVSVQSLVAPLLNAYARGEIRRDFSQGGESPQ